MKLFFILSIYFTIFVFSNQYFNNAYNQKGNSNNSGNKLNLSVKNDEKSKNDNKRFLSESDSFESITIYIDKTYMEKENSNLLISHNKVIAAIEKCVNTIQKLIKVVKKDKIKFTGTDLGNLGITSYEKIDSRLLPDGEGIQADLIIIPKFIENNSILALGRPEVFDPNTKRPVGAILLINKEFPTKSNIENYLESIILHQFIHILGFLYSSFDKFPGGFSNVIKTENETRTNKQKKFIITQNVIAYAKKYFNCDSITGVELEDGGGYDNYENSHWEARILLGELMISEIYTPEQAISGFTLALLEDSGWYKTNKFTGGLMRFGKFQGCNFLYKDCEVEDSSKNKFKNDLFTGEMNHYYKSTCTSGRQSRAYNVMNDGPSRNLQYHGKEVADKCFVSDSYQIEENQRFFVGSCRRGGGEYGQRIYYNNNYSPSSIYKSNGNIPLVFGEIISTNSFCILSSAIPSKYKLNNNNAYGYYANITHPMCYPIFCSSKSLTIKIFDQYIVCPREGGISEMKGEFEGHIYCPDYNLICTGSKLCNDIFDCVDNESLEKEDSFIYNYEIKTSQEVILEKNLQNNDISIGYELSEDNDGQCPFHCSQCKENKKCFICEESFILVGSRENDDSPIICAQEQDLSNYYKNSEDNTYYLCMENCLTCTSGDKCNSCDLKYKLSIDNSNCEEKIPHCELFDSAYEYCEQCENDYYMLNDDKMHCHNEELDDSKYFTEDGGKTYISCEEVIENCVRCDGRNDCTECKNGYKLENYNSECNSKIPNCIIFDNNYEFCKECKEGFYLLNDDKIQCHNETIDDEKYFSEDEGKTFLSCEEVIDNCLKCDGRNKCNECIPTHKIERNGAACEPKIPKCKNFDSNYEKCEECDEGYYLINDDLYHCHNTSINDSYYTEDNGKTFFRCESSIENCLKCYGKNFCKLCKEGYIVDMGNTICSLIDDPSIECFININNIDDKDKTFLNNNNINYLVQEYITNNYNHGKVAHYVNNIYNYSITIFKYYKCTKDLLNIGDYYLNTSNIFILYGQGFLISCFISFNYKNFINFFKSENGEKIDLEQCCPQCLDLKYNIQNNLTNEIVKYYSPFLLEKIKEENLDIFFPDNENFNDKCNSLDFNGINIPNKVKNYLFKDIDINEGAFICTDYQCIINSKDMNSLIFDCDCKINYDIDYLFTEINKKNNLKEEDIISYTSVNSLDIFSCFFKFGKSFTNFAFFFSLSCAIIEVSSFILYLVLKQKINLEKYKIKENADKEKEDNKNQMIETERLDTPIKEENIIQTEENIRPSVCSIEKFTSNPPPKNSIYYKYKWYKNKPKILSLENSHDEDLEIQSRDEGDPENEIMRKIKNISFCDKKSNGSSYLDETISDRDKVTETSKNKITLVSEDKSKKYFSDKIEEKKELEIHDISPIKEDKPQPLQINLPKVLTREENAKRKKKRVHSIKNIPQTKESTYPKKKEEKKIRKPSEIYLDVICIKQHIINFFSCFYNNCLEKESFIPLQMKVIRFIFLIMMNFFFNTIILGEKYFIEKYNYFNKKYNFDKSSEKDLIIPNSEKLNYIFSHSFLNAFLSFIICAFIQLIIGFIFFGTKKKIENVIEIKEEQTQKKDFNKVMSKIKALFIIFFIINFILIILFSIYITGFNIVYDKSAFDFIIPSLITFILLQILPFIICAIITLLLYLGMKNENKNLVNIAKMLLF